MARIIEIDNMITVGALAQTLELPVTKLITELMKNGVMATVNERIDFDTASIILGELDLDIELKRREQEQVELVRERRELSKSAVARPPVVAVMGHVDHGKTSLLDAIRSSSVVKQEAGGITQHISAYQVDHNGRVITFLDTPGHEAFAALREHGAQLTDLVILVVAADDGIKPQTIEAIRFARKAGVKMIVAVTKIDKPDANSALIKQQLSEHQMLVEEWGGDTVVVEVSAKTGQNVSKLLDMVLLVTDIEDLKAEISVPAEGLVIESHMEQGRGPVAIALVEHGVLRVGQFVVAGSSYGKVKLMETTMGKAIKEAGPSTPVCIGGFKILPEFGDSFRVVSDEKEARKLANDIERSHTNAGSLDMTSSELIRMINRHTQIEEFNIIIKADVQGSLTSVIDSLKTLDNDEVAVKIVGSGVGSITDSDVHMAATSNAVIYGFNVDMATAIKKIASRDKVSVRLYKVIYELIDDVKSELSELLTPEITENILGILTIKGIFKTTKSDVVCGGEVITGKLKQPSLVRVTRGKEIIGEAELIGLQKGQNEAKEVVEGDMCGLRLSTKGKLTLELGDNIEIFTREEIKRSL